MSIDKKTSVAYMCTSCGEYAFFSLNAFAFSGSRKRMLECSCGESQLVITKNTTKTFKIDIDCPVCMEKHAFSVSQSQFWSGELLIFSCPFYEANILFIGEADRIKQCVADYINEELRQLKDETSPQSKEMEFIYNACKIIKLIEAQKDSLHFCSCEAPQLTLAYNDTEIYVICKHCLTATPILSEQMEAFLEIIGMDNDFENN